MTEVGSRNFHCVSCNNAPLSPLMLHARILWIVLLYYALPSHVCKRFIGILVHCSLHFNKMKCMMMNFMPINQPKQSWKLLFSFFCVLIFSLLLRLGSWQSVLRHGSAQCSLDHSSNFFCHFFYISGYHWLNKDEVILKGQNDGTAPWIRCQYLATG